MQLAFFKVFIFREKAKLVCKERRLPIDPLMRTDRHSLLLHKHSPESDAFVSIQELTLTHH